MRLRPYADEDMWLTEAMECDPAVMAHLGGVISRAEIPAIHQRRVVVSDDDADFCVIIPDEDSGPVGTVGIWETQWDGTTIYETGWMLLPAFQGRGIATNALAMVLDRAKAAGRVDFVHAFPSVTNPASNAICRKTGFSMIEECDFEYVGRVLRCNHWRIDLRPGEC